MRRTSILAELERTSSVDADFVAGADEARQKVEIFITDRIVDNPEIEGDVHISLAQLGAGSTMSIQTWLISQGDSPSDMASCVVDRAMEDGGAIGSGKVKYQVTIQGHTGRCAFTLEYQPAGDDDLDEVPNNTGIVAQMLKHNQELHKFTLNLMKTTVQDHREQRKENVDEIKNLRSSQVENIQMYAQLFDSKHARDLEVKKLEKSEARKDEVAGFLMQGIPHVIQKLVGGEKAIIEAKSTPLEQMLHGWLSTFTQEQLQTTVQTGQIQLRQDQMMGMLGIFQAVQAKEAAAEAKPQPGPQPSSPPGGPG